LLRVGSIAFLAGVVIAILSTTIHPSREEAFEYTNFKSNAIPEDN
jgi:hypothetical protein